MFAHKIFAFASGFDLANCLYYFHCKDYKAALAYCIMALLFAHLTVKYEEKNDNKDN